MRGTQRQLRYVLQRESSEILVLKRGVGSRKTGTGSTFAAGLCPEQTSHRRACPPYSTDLSAA